MEPYPLRFRPIFQSYIWGGRRLETVLGKLLPQDGNDYAESWEVVDHDDGQSVVVDGPLQGVTLSQLVAEHGEALLGKHHPQKKFPLLFKFLDCQRNLSVQVHPNDAQGSKLDPPDLGKTEAWVIMAAEPGSRLYAGLKPGVDLAAFRRELENGTAETCLHVVDRMWATASSFRRELSTHWLRDWLSPRFNSPATQRTGSMTGTASAPTESHDRCIWNRDSP